MDISQHFYTPQKTSSRNENETPGGSEAGLSEAQLRQMMLGLDRPGDEQIPTMAGATEEDPLMKMMQQMMAGAGAGGANFPPGSSSPFPSMPNGAPPSTPDPYTSLWRILHATIALGLGLYIAVLTPFTGTKMAREREALAASTAADPLTDEANEQRKRVFFWAFATAEAVLLTTRFFLFKGHGANTGMAWTVAGYLPDPLRSYVMVALRYGQIFTTVRADILVCVFVLGMCSWWRT